MNTTTQTTHLKQPTVFKLAFFTAMCERFGYYLIADLLVLYLKAVFNFSDTHAFALFGVFTALTYITPAIGGYLGDNVLGIRRSLRIGLVLEGIGMLILGFGGKSLLLAGLACAVTGVGFFKIAPTDLLARAYTGREDPRIDSGFTLYYMAINVGSFVSAWLAAGILKYHFGWYTAFAVAGFSLFLGLICYLILRRSAASVDVDCGSRYFRDTKMKHPCNIFGEKQRG